MNWIVWRLKYCCLLGSGKTRFKFFIGAWRQRWPRTDEDSEGSAELSNEAQVGNCQLKQHPVEQKFTLHPSALKPAATHIQNPPLIQPETSFSKQTIDVNKWQQCCITPSTFAVSQAILTWSPNSPFPEVSFRRHCSSCPYQSMQDNLPQHCSTCHNENISASFLCTSASTTTKNDATSSHTDNHQAGCAGFCCSSTTTTTTIEAAFWHWKKCMQPQQRVWRGRGWWIHCCEMLGTTGDMNPCTLFCCITCC